MTDDREDEVLAELAQLAAKLAAESDEQLEARLTAAQQESAASGGPTLTIIQSMGPAAWKWQIKAGSRGTYTGWRDTRRKALEEGLVDLDVLLRRPAP